MVEFPIMGSFRFVILGLEVIVLFLSIQFGVIFLRKFLQARKELRMSKMFLLWGVYFLAFGVMFAIYLKSDFYATTDRVLFLNVGYISMNVGLLLFSIILESFKAFQMKGIWKHLFSIIFLACLLILIFLSILMPDQEQDFVAVIIFPTLILLLRYCYLLYQRIKATQKFEAVILFLMVLSLYAGYLFTSDYAMEMWSYQSRVFGDILMIASLVLSAWFFNRLPSIEEFDWFNLLESIFVVDAAGINLYHKFFQAGDAKRPGDDQLITGALTSIKNILEAMVEQGAKLKIMDQGDKVILLEYGKSLTYVMICQKVLPSHRILLAKFAKEFETAFNEVLANWDGNLNKFKNAEIIADHVFHNP